MDARGDWEAQWAKRIPRLAALVTVSQHGAALDGIAAVAAQLTEAGHPEDPLEAVDPAAFAGWIERTDGSGALLTDALYSPVITSRQADGAPEQMLEVGLRRLELIVRESIAGASSLATQAQTVATPRTHATFYDPPPMCPRCAVLVGKRVKPWTRFKRHPGCDGGVEAIHESDPRSAAADLEDVQGLSLDQRRAVEHGADLNQVINATTRVAGGRAPRSPLIDGGTRTLSARSSKRKGKPSRLTPKGVYDLAGNDRSKAVKLLRENGYIF